MQFPVIGVLILFDIHIPKEGTKKTSYKQDLGVISDCTKSMAEAAMGLGEMKVNGATNDCFF